MNRRGSLGDGENLRVSRRIRQHLHLIVAASDDASVLGDESTDRDLFGGGCLSCQPQGFAHECLIIPEQ